VPQREKEAGFADATNRVQILFNCQLPLPSPTCFYSQPCWYFSHLRYEDLPEATFAHSRISISDSVGISKTLSICFGKRRHTWAPR